MDEPQLKPDESPSLRNRLVQLAKGILNDPNASADMKAQAANTLREAGLSPPQESVQEAARRGFYGDPNAGGTAPTGLTVNPETPPRKPLAEQEMSEPGDGAQVAK